MGREMRYILGNNQLDALFHVFIYLFIYLMSLHVSSVTALIIRRSNCVNTLPPDSCEHCPHPVDRPFKLSTLQLHSTVRVPLNEHNFSQYKHI